MSIAAPLVVTQTIGPGRLTNALADLQRKAQTERLVGRIAAGDPTVWVTDPAAQTAVANRLGWLRIASVMQGRVDELEQFAAGVFRDGIHDVVLLGMGGSSLCPAVFGRIFPRPAGRGMFLVLDLTVPSAVRRVEQAVDLSRCLFVSASKSGKTIETLSHTEYFWGRVSAAAGSKVGDHFVAITDKGSALEELALARRFRRVFINPADIGGRYSALSFFGLVPGALAGIPLKQLLESATAAESAGLAGDAADSAIMLGLYMGAAAQAGRDKLTFVAPPTLAPLVPWIEQLVAESTGKNKTGVIPIEGEPPLDINDYGEDRAFVFFQLDGDQDQYLDFRDRLQKAGHPVAVVKLADVTQIGGEFFRWELATAVAGWVLGVNPFDEPNVQESKDNTQRVLADLVARGNAALPQTIVRAGGISILGASVSPVGDDGADLAEHFRRWTDAIANSGYVSILAYLDDTPQTEGALARIRKSLAQQTRKATLRGFGPRYLHSIGQLYKGGPPNGAFLLITADDPEDSPIPGASYTFSTLKMAQALGDAESLAKRGWPLLHVHIQGELARGLNYLIDVMT